jgi:BirA family biotin operon repressor/biotin-[acetyl-CoA-carboxylase] ligase
MSPADALDVKRLTQALRNQCIGHAVVVLQQASSTNDIVFAMAAESDEGLVVFAERQTAGRGQHGRRWESAPGKGLWFSVLLRPNVPPNEATGLTSWAARTIAETIARELALPAFVKPPNDVYIADRKVAGVLLEMRAVAGAPHVGILGIGLNVRQAADDFPPEIRQTATSLALASGQPIDRHSIAISLLRDLDRTYEQARAL